MSEIPRPGRTVLPVKLSCVFMTPEESEPPRHVSLKVDIDAYSTPKHKKKTKNKPRPLRSKKRKLKHKKDMVQQQTGQGPCTEHTPEKVFTTGPRDNNEYTWRCAVCKAELG